MVKQLKIIEILLNDCDSSDMFSLAYQWQDKPHRHVFDLCDWIDELLKERAQD
jgi:hypothetical protein